MSADNCINLIGRLGRDPEVKVTPSGTAIANFSLAVNKGFGDKKHTLWLNCKVFGKQAEVAEKYLRKGKELAVSGELDIREWKDKEGATRVSVEVEVRDFRMIGARDEGGERPAAQDQGGAGDDESDIPF